MPKYEEMWDWTALHEPDRCSHSRTKIEAVDFHGARIVLTSCRGCGVLLRNREIDMPDPEAIVKSQDAWNLAYAEAQGWRP